MFIPQTDEEDVYDVNGNQIDDVNSLMEYIDQVVLGKEDDAREDEDDDNAVYYHLTKIDQQFNLQQYITQLNQLTSIVETSIHYLPYKDRWITPIFFDVQSPPPKSSSRFIYS
jgi:hypothetical protein